MVDATFITGRVPAYLRDLVILAVIQSVLLVFFVFLIPLPRMYAWADSAEYQRIALYIVGQGSLKSGYPQAFLPGQSFVVAAFYTLTGNIDYASLITNFIFGLSCLFTLRFLTKELRLSILFMFIPYWLILSFSTLGDAAFILMELVVAWLVIHDRNWFESVAIGSLSMLFRPEGLFLMVALAIVVLKKRKFRYRYIIPPTLAVVAILLWALVAFGNPLGYISTQAGSSWSMALDKLAKQLANDYSLGLVGKGKIAYVFATLVASVCTLIGCFRRYGAFHFFFLESLILTLAHTVFSPPHIYPEMAKLYVQVAPFTIIVFKELLLKRFAIVVAILVPLAIFTAMVFWTVTFSVPFF